MATVTATDRLEVMGLGKKQFEDTLGPLEGILEKERVQREVQLACGGGCFANNVCADWC